MQTMWNKYKILLGIEILILLFFLPGCFQKEILIYTNSNIALTEDKLLYESEKFSVKPGVYQIRIAAGDTDREQVRFAVKAENGTFRALRCNEAILTSGYEFLDFEMYVTDSIDEVHIECYASGRPTVIDSLEIYRMNWGGRMGTFLFVLLCLGLNFMLVFRERILNAEVTKEKQVAFWTLFACVLIAYFPYMTDYIPYAQESMQRWLRIEQIKECLVWGTNRTMVWSPEDLFLLLPAMFGKIGFSLVTSYKMFVFLIIVVSAGVAYYSFGKCVKEAALPGTIVYILATQRLSAIYESGAIGEALALCFLPLVACGMYGLLEKTIDGESYYRKKIPLIIGMSGILYAHTLVFVWTVAMVFVACVIFGKRTIRKETLVQLLQALVIGLLLNMWYWVPLLNRYMNHNPILQEGNVWSVLLVLPEALIVSHVCLWLSKKQINGNLRFGIIAFAMILFVGRSIYFVNNIAFTHSPIWLYTVDGLGVSDIWSQGESMANIVDKAGCSFACVLISALTLLGIVIFGIKRSVQWKQKMQKFSEK